MEEPHHKLLLLLTAHLNNLVALRFEEFLEIDVLKFQNIAALLVATVEINQSLGFLGNLWIVKVEYNHRAGIHNIKERVQMRPFRADVSRILHHPKLVGSEQIIIHEMFGSSKVRTIADLQQRQTTIEHHVITPLDEAIYPSQKMLPAGHSEAIGIRRIS